MLKAKNPCELPFTGQFVDYILEMQRFMNMEIEEILQLLPVDARKPWKATHRTARLYPVSGLVDMSNLQREAIDALCFMLNICLACGVTPENVEALYDEVYTKNNNRANNDY